MMSQRIAFSLLGCLLLIAFWEIGAYVIGSQSANPAIVWPHISTIIFDAFPGLATVDTTGSNQVSAAVNGSVLGAVNVLAPAALTTIIRVIGGTAIGLVAGVGLGAMLALLDWFRQLFSPLLHTLRQVPLFALTLVFVLWFGGDTTGILVFVSYGTALMTMVATQDAINAVPDIHIRYAQTLGASRLTVIRTVVTPAIVPTVSASILVVTGLAWAMVMAAEFLGTQAGLGRMVLFFEKYHHTGQMVVVAVAITALASVSHLIVSRVLSRFTRWVPRGTQ